MKFCDDLRTKFGFAKFGAMLCAKFPRNFVRGKLSFKEFRRNFHTVPGVLVRLVRNLSLSVSPGCALQFS